MKAQDEVRRLNRRIEALEQELRTAKQMIWLGLTGSMLQHTLINEVRNIAIYVEMIRHFEADTLSERVDKYLNRIQASVDATRDELVTAPNFSEPPSIGVDDFLADYASTVCQRMDGDINVKLESSTEAHVKINPEWLRHCVDLIVQNALEAMRDSSEKVLTLSATSADEHIEICIGDTGPGVPSVLRSQIFRIPVEAVERKGQLGFGLLLAKTIVEAFGGDVRLDVAKQEGATFIISLPKG